jgi:hypothetical protein
MTRAFAVLLLIPVFTAIIGVSPRRQPPATVVLRAGPTIGAQSGPQYELLLERAVFAVAPSGNLLLAQPDRGEVREFGRDGVWIRTLGRRGRGPGEFQSISDIRTLGDSMWIADAALRRVTLFVGGRVLRTSAVQEVPDETTPRMQLADGGVLFSPQLAGTALAQGKRTARVAITDASGKQRFVRSVRRGSTAFGLARNGLTTVGMDRLRPLSQDHLILVEQSGKHIVLVDRTVKPGATTSSARVEHIRATGEQESAFTVTGSSTAVDARAMRAVVQQTATTLLRLTPGAFRGTDDAVSAILQQIDPPTLLPAVSDALMDGDDAVCVKASVQVVEATVRRTPSEWSCYRLDGRLVRRFTVPVGFELRAIRGATAWAATESPDGVPLVVRLIGLL